LSFGTVYNNFRRMLTHFEISAYTELLTEIGNERWAFIHSASMGFAYLLTPKYFYGEAMIGSDKLDTINQFYNYIPHTCIFIKPCEIAETKLQFQKYLSQFSLMPVSKKADIFGMPALSYWAILGKQQFPLLSKIALRLFTIPISSAASERVWSVYSFIHSKL